MKTILTLVFWRKDYFWVFVFKSISPIRINWIQAFYLKLSKYRIIPLVLSHRKLKRWKMKFMKELLSIFFIIKGEEFIFWESESFEIQVIFFSYRKGFQYSQGSKDLTMKLIYQLWLESCKKEWFRVSCFSIPLNRIYQMESWLFLKKNSKFK